MAFGATQKRVTLFYSDQTNSKDKPIDGFRSFIGWDKDCFALKAVTSTTFVIRTLVGRFCINIMPPKSHQFAEAVEKLFGIYNQGT